MNSKALLDERRLLWKWCFAQTAFAQVERMVGLIESSGWKETDPLYLDVASAAVVFYARPFTRSKGGVVLSKSVVPQRFESFHENLMAFRHQTAAHSDANANLEPIGRPLNAVTIKLLPNGTYRFKNSRNPPKFSKLIELRELALELAAIGTVFIEEFAAKYADEVPDVAGDYALNLETGEGPLWRPVSPRP